MSSSVIKSALSQVVCDITGLSPNLVVWRGSLAERSMVIGTRVVLYANSKRTIGVDETRIDAPPATGEEQLVTRSGQRTMTWSILCETQQLTADQDAGDILDLIRINLQRQSVRDKLNDVGLSVASFAGTSSSDFLSGGRTVSQATMDVYLNTVDVSQDLSEGSGYWIGEAIIDGTASSNSIHIDVDERA